MPDAILEQEIERIVAADHPVPPSVLGPHPDENGDSAYIVRAFVPAAEEMWVLHGGVVEQMRKIHPEGLFVAGLESREPASYRFRARGAAGNEWEWNDPYAFPSSFGDLDLHLMGEGRDLELYRKLGAHPTEIEGVSGTRFGVWAPNARRVSVVGAFNGWDGRVHAMRLHESNGVWEIFVPGIGPGELYKYEIKPQLGAPYLKSDPLAFYSELRPGTASVVHGMGRYPWSDDEWMSRRGVRDWIREPISIYEVHLGSWQWDNGRALSYTEVADRLADYVTDLGFTHVEFMPLMEHPYDPSWGYQVTGYYAPTSRFGSPEEFRRLVDRLHQRGIGVLLDWVPAHFPKDSAGLRRFDGTALYEHSDPRQGEHPDWGTLIFNYGRNEVRNFLIANALYWLEQFHIDGLRVDAVASMLYLDYSREEGEWLPNQYGGRENLEALEFFRELNSHVRDRFPGALMIAEESTSFPGVTHPVEHDGLGFHLKWNMGWMNDFLRYIEEDPVHRKYHSRLLTFSLMYTFSENFVLPISHDEVVHGKRSLISKMPGDEWQMFANMRLALGFMWGHPGKQLLFMGSEFGQWQEWSEARPLDWGLLEKPLHRGLQNWVRDLNRIYRNEPALWQRDATHEGFDWIDFHDVENSVISFLRRTDDEELVFVCNFTPVPRHGYRIGVPQGGRYKELLNSDAGVYGGGDVGNGGGVDAEEIKAHNRRYSLNLNIPPLGVLILKREED